jgi:hypothetical protein
LKLVLGIDSKLAEKDLEIKNLKDENEMVLLTF